MPDSQGHLVGIADEYGTIWVGEPGASERIGDLVQRDDEETFEVRLRSRSAASYEREIRSLSKALSDECANSKRLADKLGAAEVTGRASSSDPRFSDAALPSDAYIAVRFPASHVVFHMLIDAETLGERPADVYDALSRRVQASVREALATLGVHVIETSEEAIGAE